jgi:hypothetical protein
MIPLTILATKGVFTSFTSTVGRATNTTLYTRNVFSMLDGITNIANRKGQLVNQEAFAILT